jgi:hypothetical protein
MLQTVLYLPVTCCRRALISSSNEMRSGTDLSSSAILSLLALAIDTFQYYCVVGTAAAIMYMQAPDDEAAQAEVPSVMVSSAMWDWAVHNSMHPDSTAVARFSYESFYGAYG